MQSQIPVKRKIKFEYVKDNQDRASVKYKRYQGITTKIRWFDRLTGSQSCFLTLDRKSALKIFSNGVSFDDAMPEISACISKDNSNVKQTKISEANCDLVDEKKPLWQSSQRIINHHENDKIIYSSLLLGRNHMRNSKSIDFMSFKSPVKEASNGLAITNENQKRRVLKSNQNINNLIK